MKKVALLIILVPVLFVQELSSEVGDEFTVQRPPSGLHSRQQLRERFAEALSEYLELLVEELSLIAKRLSLIDMPCTDREQKKCTAYVRTLYEAQQFLRDGTLMVIRPLSGDGNQDDQGDSRKLYSALLDAIAGTQREVINVLHCLLERDTACCFVACKAKIQLEKYAQQVRCFVRLTTEQNGYLRTIVQNFEKSSC